MGALLLTTVVAGPAKAGEPGGFDHHAIPYTLTPSVPAFAAGAAELERELTASEDHWSNRMAHVMLCDMLASVAV